MVGREIGGYLTKLERDYGIIVKRRADKIDIPALKAKAGVFLRATGEFDGYSISYRGLSMDDM